MRTDETASARAKVGVAHGIENESIRAQAAVLAEELGLPFVDSDLPSAETPELLLVVGERRLELREAGRGLMGPIFVDFVRGPVGFRRRSGRSRRQPIGLAVGLPRGPVTVVDATAGLAQDSFLLASLGCTVIAVERSPVLGALIRDGLRRARAEGSPEVVAVVDRITFIADDARNVLARMTGTTAPQVVYIDPMYPPKKKTALPKKEMRICRRLVGDDQDAGELLMIARQVATRRVVVKRHPYAAPLAPRPAIQFPGKKVRYDVYRPIGYRLPRLRC